MEQITDHCVIPQKAPQLNPKLIKEQDLGYIIYPMEIHIGSVVVFPFE